MTVKELLEELKGFGGLGNMESKGQALSNEDMDMTPKKFGGKLREQQEALKEKGCLVDFLGKREGHNRVS